MKTKTKIGIVASLVVILALAGFVYFKFYFPFGEGVKAGELNRIVYKGYVFKTYEGKIIQAGFGNSETTPKKAAIQSNEFDFSVVDKNVADSLMYHCGGKEVELHYIEYKGTLPWRGMQKFIVDKIVAVH